MLHENHTSVECNICLLPKTKLQKYFNIVLCCISIFWKFNNKQIPFHIFTNISAKISYKTIDY